MTVAADLMTSMPRTLFETESVSRAIEAMQTANVRHLPIVDGGGHLVGMLSDRDLGPLMIELSERAEVDNEVMPLSQRRVSELMCTDVVSVEPDTEIEEVVTRMVDRRIGAIPVVDRTDAVLGIISYLDVLGALGAPNVERRRKP